MELQSLYQNAIQFAGEKHYCHKLPAVKANYVVHLSNVAMEVMIASFHTKNFDVNFAIQVAILHDTLEDTDTSFLELESEFGSKIAQAVLALTKDEYMQAEKQMADSIERIKTLPHEIWAVKLADRITNMQEPPSHWHKDRKLRYKNESDVIYQELKDGNPYLAKRLKEKIKWYAL
jgi:(p)ppGpp synthase/HD superfamily hydrolase